MGRVYPLVVKRGDGLTIEDVDGNRFLDFNAGIAVSATGHGHPRVLEAIERQAREVVAYCSSDFYHPVYAEVCERLARSVQLGGPAKVFLANSGTEAVEASLKLARFVTGRPNVIAFLGSFHGRSLGSLSLTASKGKYRSGFGVAAPGVYHAPYAGSEGLTGADYIEQVIFRHLTEPSDIAAVIVEPVQGEGGYIVPPDGWLEDLRSLCTRHGILLIADEVQSGVGRTGKMWAVDHENIEPDILLAGKGLASGMPLSAMVARADLMTWTPGKHGSTFGGNPVACAAAAATLDLVTESLADNAAAVGAYLLERLSKIVDAQPLITGVHGRGLMIGIDLVDRDAAAAVELACFHRGLLVLTCGERSLRMAPPLTVTRAQADAAVEILASACHEASGTAGA